MRRCPCPHCDRASPGDDAPCVVCARFCQPLAAHVGDLYALTQWRVHAIVRALDDEGAPVLALLPEVFAGRYHASAMLQGEIAALDRAFVELCERDELS